MIISDTAYFLPRVKERAGFGNTRPASNCWCATLNPMWLIKIGWDSSKTPLQPFKPLSWLWLHSQEHPSSLSSTQHLQQPLSQKHKIKTLWRPQLLLWAATAGWLLLKPDPATLHQPGSPLSLKGCLMGGGEGDGVGGLADAAGQETAAQRGTEEWPGTYLSSHTFIHD